MICSLWCGLVLTWCAQNPAPMPQPPVGKVRKIDLGALVDIEGRPLVSPKGGSPRWICLIFMGTECPVSNGYCPEYRSLHNDYRSKGVLFVGVHPDPDVDAKRAREHAREYEVPFVLHLDPRQALAHSAGVSFTPEAAIVGSDGQVLWSGRIDDTWMPDGKKRASVSKKDLRLALDAVLGGKSPPPAAAKPYGCPLPEIHENR